MKNEKQKKMENKHSKNVWACSTIPIGMKMVWPLPYKKHPIEYIFGSRISIMSLNDTSAEAYWSALVGLVFLWKLPYHNMVNLGRFSKGEGGLIQLPSLIWDNAG